MSGTLSAAHSPTELTDFTTVGVPGKTRAPSTQANLWIWLQGHQRYRVHYRARAYVAALSACTHVALDLPVFTRHENRDLTGGTANPKEDLRFDVALIPSGKPGQGGSIALSQKWRHDLGVFNAQPIPTQEAVIGRSKIDDVELRGNDMPANSHVSRTDLTVDGEALKIYRRSAPT